MDTSLSLSATAGKLAVPPSAVSQQRRHTAQGLKKKTVKDATPIKEEAHEEDSDESAGKRAINMQRVPSRERAGRNLSQAGASSRGESLDRDSRGQDDIVEDLKGIEDAFIARSNKNQAKHDQSNEFHSNTNSVPIEESSKSASGFNSASVEKVRNLGPDKVVVEAIEEDDDYSANFDDKSESMTASAQDSASKHRTILGGNRSSSGSLGVKRNEYKPLNSAGMRATQNLQQT